MILDHAHRDGTTIVLHPAPSLTVVTLLVRYEWAEAGKLHKHSLLVGHDGVTVEQIVRIWTAKNDRVELIDWCVSEYAPIPF